MIMEVIHSRILRLCGREVAVHAEAKSDRTTVQVRASAKQNVTCGRFYFVESG